MIKISEIYEKYSKMGHTERLFTARMTLEALLEHFGTLTNSSDDALTVIMAFVAASVGADGTFCDAEVDLCTELLHLSREHALSLLRKASHPKRIAAAHGLYDVCESEIQMLILDFCLCFIACDGRVNPQENKFIKSLIA